MKLTPFDQLPKPVQIICRELNKAGYRGWLVGGCVRDMLRGKPQSDYDLCTDATPKQVMGIFRKVIPTGIEHGTVSVLLGGTPYEVTTLRGEGSYSDGRRPDEVHFVTSIEADLARRDFTVNAMAYDPLGEEVGQLEDPFEGQRDLADKCIRAVGVAEERFSEDGLRVLRAARFVAALEGGIHPETKAAIPKTLATFRKVSPERIAEEWRKALKYAKPSMAFELMAETGILEAISHPLWEAWEAAHPVFTSHRASELALRACNCFSGDSLLRLAALLSPLASGKAPRKSPSYALLKQLRFSNNDRDRVAGYVESLALVLPSGPGPALRRFMQQVGPNEAQSCLKLRQALDPRAESSAYELLLGAAGEELAQGTPFRTAELAINGKDLMSIGLVSKGPLLGKCLQSLLAWVIENPSRNERGRLLLQAKEWQARQEGPFGGAAGSA